MNFRSQRNEYPKVDDTNQQDGQDERGRLGQYDDGERVDYFAVVLQIVLLVDWYSNNEPEQVGADPDE